MIYNQVSVLRNFHKEREHLCNVIERGAVKIETLKGRMREA